MCSFNARDIPATTTETNAATHNWIGPSGAWMAHFLFMSFGAGAFVLPMLMLLVALGCFFETLGYLRRRWPWTAVVLLCCVGLLDLYTDKTLVDKLAANPKLPAGFLEQLSRNLTTPSAGGVLGFGLNQFVFNYFGRPGATIVYSVLYAVSLFFLTNFQLGIWLRSAFSRDAVSG